MVERRKAHVFYRYNQFTELPRIISKLDGIRSIWIPSMTSAGVNMVAAFGSRVGTGPRLHVLCLS